MVTGVTTVTVSTPQERNDDMATNSSFLFAHSFELQVTS